MSPWLWLQFWKAAAFNGEKCYVFDRDGSGCRRQRCGTEMYDASVCLEKIGETKKYACSGLEWPAEFAEDIDRIDPVRIYVGRRPCNG